MQGPVSRPRRVGKTLKRTADLKRNGNQTVCPGAVYETVPTSEEMDAFEALGPMTQRALKTLPLKIAAAGILRQLHDAGDNPKAPHVDLRVAAIVNASVRNLIMGDAAPGEAMRVDYELHRHKRARRVA